MCHDAREKKKKLKSGNGQGFCHPPTPTYTSELVPTIRRNEYWICLVHRRHNGAAAQVRVVHHSKLPAANERVPLSLPRPIRVLVLLAW
jgi:hypothetical protein